MVRSAVKWLEENATEVDSNTGKVSLMGGL